MAIVEVCSSNNRELQNIANILAAASKIVVVTGAGISTNCGIPDFRSKDGLYSLIQSNYQAAISQSSSVSIPSEQIACSEESLACLPGNVKGKDLFDSMIWKDPTSTAVFYTFIASLREKIRRDVKHTTATHRFIRLLRDRRKLLRCYTQNIDGLEAREGMSVDLGRGQGSRQRFSRKTMAKPNSPARSSPGGVMDAGCEVVQLHGDVEKLRCTFCQSTCDWTAGIGKHLLAGIAPHCPQCVDKDQERRDRGKRGIKVGTLRPNIVLYGEEHPSADLLGRIMTNDLGMAPDVLLILGTSLHVHGLKTMVREFAKSVHAKAGAKGKVIFVNLSKPSESGWTGVIDYWIGMDCDAWVGATRRHRPDLWQVQETLKLPIRKSAKFKPALVEGMEGKTSSEEKENILAQDGRPRPPIKPRVIIPETPKKKQPLQDHDPLTALGRFGGIRSLKRSTAADSTKTTIDIKKVDASFRSQQSKATPHTPLTQKRTSSSAFDSSPSTQLPTPESLTSASGSEMSRSKRRRTLTQNYVDLVGTPSKRRRQSVAIWEDAD